MIYEQVCPVFKNKNVQSIIRFSKKESCKNIINFHTFLINQKLRKFNDFVNNRTCHK